jgi:hypothetical protein
MNEMSTTPWGPYIPQRYVGGDVTQNSRMLKGLVKRGKLGTCVLSENPKNHLSDYRSIYLVLITYLQVSEVAYKSHRVFLDFSDNWFCEREEH